MFVDTKRPPDLQPLLKILEAHALRYVVTGSVTALLYGVELAPGDSRVQQLRDIQRSQRLTRGSDRHR